jgi:hypothetical protein
VIYSEVKYQPERSRSYLGSPSLIRLPDGTLVASHDYFGELRTPENECALSSIYRSEDNGVTWQNVTHLIGAFWGTLFLHRNFLYHISCSREYGDIVIRRSTDGGFTWSLPRDEKNGLLFRGGKAHQNPNYHFGGATPVLFHNGRIWKGGEDLFIDGTPPEWHASRFQAFALSASEDADLLDASSWTMSNKLFFAGTTVNEPGLLAPDSNWSNGYGWLEGNIVAAPDGKLHNLLRMHLAKPNKAAILNLSDDGKELTFCGKTGIIDFIGGASKFTIRRDPVTGLYFTLTNFVTEAEYPTRRNILNLAVSEDLRAWKNLGTILFDDSGFEPRESAAFTGFQYPDWQFDGDDIIYLVRTAYRGAHNFHDSNRITFHVLKEFRKYLKNG